MKALHKFLTALLLILSLTACTSGSSEPYTILKGENRFTVDPVNHSISDGANVYLYELDGNSSDCNIKITYPNGSTYWWHSQTSGGMTTGYGGQSDDYDAAKYIEGHILCDILEEEVPAAKRAGQPLISILLFICGALTTAAPRFFWNLKHGWLYKNAEPSDAAINAGRVSGILLMIAAIVLLFIW